MQLSRNEFILIKVSWRIWIKVSGVSWSEMLHGTTFLATCLAISVETGIEFLTASFYWLLNGNIARQIARGMLLCTKAKKYIAALRQSSRKVESDFTSCNATCNKNVVWLYDCKTCYSLQLHSQVAHSVRMAAEGISMQDDGGGSEVEVRASLGYRDVVTWWGNFNGELMTEKIRKIFVWIIYIKVFYNNWVNKWFLQQRYIIVRINWLFKLRVITVQIFDTVQ